MLRADFVEYSWVLLIGIIASGIKVDIDVAKLIQLASKHEVVIVIAFSDKRADLVESYNESSVESEFIGEYSER